MFKFLAILSTMFLVSCNGALDGILKIHEAVSFNTQYDGSVTFEPGEHDVKISIHKKSNYIKLNFPIEADEPDFPDEGGSAGDSSLEVHFKYPKSMKLPETNGAFTITPAQSGQSVTLDGELKTVVDKGALSQDHNERCQYQERRTECFTDSRGRTTCSDRWETTWGNRYVEFIPVRTTKTFTIVLSSPKARKADMTVQEIHVERDYTFQGHCR